MSQPTNTRQRICADADRYHELLCQLKALQTLTERAVHDSLDADIGFGLALFFEQVIAGLETFTT